MNIFTVLSQGKGRLNEENLSAMLGYLLTPSQTHGLGDTFLRPFLIAVAEACGDTKRFDHIMCTSKAIRAEMFLESPYQVGKQRRVVDMELRIFSRSLNSTSGEFEDVELHRIAIENKVKPQAADSTQFKEEFLGIVQDLEDDEKVAITMVFLTPPGESSRLVDEYNALDVQLLASHRKAWLRWAGPDDQHHHIVALLRHLLRQETEAEISPIADYLRHTIKAFIRHIQESPAGTMGRTSEARESPELGDIVQVVAVQLGDVVYQIERYESSTVRVLNTNTQEYEVAKPVLRRANDEQTLGINIFRANGRSKNTRTLGREVIRALLTQNKVVQPNEIS
jgi:PD-(D/E)XK nuclease superfamily